MFHRICNFSTVCLCVLKEKIEFFLVCLFFIKSYLNVNVLSCTVPLLIITIHIFVCLKMKNSKYINHNNSFCYQKRHLQSFPQLVECNLLFHRIGILIQILSLM